MNLSMIARNCIVYDPQRQSDKWVKYWFLGGCILIYVMVLTGGITRLTHSGLSMVNWDFVLGSFPPITDSDWKVPFEKYKLSPEFRLINKNFGLKEFKRIYWWEYIHRFTGRFIGIFFLLPYVWFIKNKKFSLRQYQYAFLLLIFGILQGFIGWFMVKSGLYTIPRVSHFRLALHLGNAFLLIYFAFSAFLENPNKKPERNIKAVILINSLVCIVFIQIILGAFVSGLHAGLIYNTFPLMGSTFVPPEIPALLLNTRYIFNHATSVQFLHRMIAFSIVVLSAKAIYNLWEIKRMKKQLLFLGASICIQFLLGVTALLCRVPVVIGVLHQAGAFMLFLSVILLKRSYS